jgi:hypothetical protein
MVILETIVWEHDMKKSLNVIGSVQQYGAQDNL